jgi:hypothetical protein
MAKRTAGHRRWCGLGCVGSACNNGMFDPAVPNCFNVESVNAAAGLVTKLKISVCSVSAALLAASNESSVAPTAAVSGGTGGQ